MPDIREFIISDSDSDIGSEYLSDSSDDEWNKKMDELEKSIALKEWEILFLDYERQIDELEQARSEKIALRADYNELKAINKNLERDKKALKNKITGLESDKATLEANIIDLEIEKNEWKEKYEVQARKERIITIFFNITKAANDYLPIPRGWKDTNRAKINAITAYVLWKDTPTNLVYDGSIMVTGIGLWYLLLYTKLLLTWLFY